MASASRGVPRAHLPSFRATSWQRVQRTGIGLSIVRKAVERMGGRVASSPRLGKAAALDRIAESFKSGVIYGRGDIIDRSLFNRQTILLVEDNEDDVFIMQSAFRKRLSPILCRLRPQASRR